jgi:hypothetical protein
LFQIAPPTAGSTLDLSAGLPILVSINGTPLNVDGQTIKLDPAQSVVLSLVADRMPNAFYQWNIYELVPNSAMPATGLDFKAVYVADCLDTSVTIPNDVFVAGKVYTVRAFAIKGGYPAIGTGDLQQRELPYAAGYHDSGVFTVSAL